MSTHTAVRETQVLTPQQALLTDQIGNEVYASHYAERKAYRLIIGCGTILLLGSMGLNLSLSRRPVVNRYIRIDEMGRAQAIQYSDLNYSPREGEVRTYLMDWANYRYTISHDTIAKKYPLNYYFLSQALASQLIPPNTCWSSESVALVTVFSAPSRWVIKMTGVAPTEIVVETGIAVPVNGSFPLMAKART